MIDPNALAKLRQAYALLKAQRASLLGEIEPLIAAHREARRALELKQAELRRVEEALKILRSLAEETT